jgi:hypothetical protein
MAGLSAEAGTLGRRALVAPRRTLLCRTNLKHVANSRVGGGGTRGVSGGERRRVYIVALLFSKPEALLLDEPTSGLDSAQALNVVCLLKDLCQDRIVLATVHQPCSTAFALFDDVTLMHTGRIVFGGDNVALIAHFESIGCVLRLGEVDAEDRWRRYGPPPQYNPADHFLDLLSVDGRSPGALKRTSARVRAIMAHAKCDDAPGDLRHGAPPASGAKPPRNWFAQCKSLAWRSFKTTDPAVFIGMTVGTILKAALQAFIFNPSGGAGGGAAGEARETFGAWAVACIMLSQKPASVPGQRRRVTRL